MVVAMNVERIAMSRLLNTASPEAGPAERVRATRRARSPPGEVGSDPVGSLKLNTIITSTGSAR